MPSGNPRARRAGAQASAASAVSSFGWLKCVLTQIGWWRSSSAHSSGVTRKGKRHRQPRAEAQDLDVGDGAQLGEQPVEAVVGEDERIAAREQHVADLRACARIQSSATSSSRRCMVQSSSPTMRLRRQKRQ